MSHPYLTQLKKDKKLSQLVLSQPAIEPLETAEEAHYLALCRSIMSQQISTQVARVIFERFMNLFDRSIPLPKEILSIPIETYRSIGLSQSKANYMHAIASFFVEHPHLEKQLHLMSNEEVEKTLTQIKGVGKWTVEMFLIFQLGREDVFSVGDFGIQKSMTAVYGLDETLPQKSIQQEMLKISGKWKPYRSYACLHLWQLANTLRKNSKKP